MGACGLVGRTVAIRYVPPKGYQPSNPLPRGPQNGYVDRFGNEWVRGLLVPKVRRLNGMYNCHELVKRSSAGLLVTEVTLTYLSMVT